MTDPVSRYFGAERAEGILLLVVALVAVEIAFLVWRRSGSPAARGAAATLVLVAAMQVTAGAGQLMRSSHEQSRVVRALASDRADIGGYEIPRMRERVGRFALVRRIEVALALLGVLMAAAARRRHWAGGAGLALALQAAVMLLLGGLADHRARAYLDWLLTL